MKIIVKCQNCGNEAEIYPVTVGNVGYFSQSLTENDFNVNTYIDAELQQDTVSDSDEVDTKLKEIHISCRKCHEFIILDF